MSIAEAQNLISDVTDTALWVAVYRGMESERPDALFNDPYAYKLTGDKGRRIAKAMKSSSHYTSWAVVIRTYIIDRFIQELIDAGVDTVINLGAGLDSRPYRMKLPANLRWIEVDYPAMIERKEKILASDKPQCQLERVKMDLADRSMRQMFFAETNGQTRKALILTEGVIPYLTEVQAGELADDLHRQNHFTYWITDYFSPKVYKYMQSKKRQAQMKNAPVVFYPTDWFQFYASHGWSVKEMRYNGEESQKLGRRPPAPWWAAVLSLLMPAKQKAEMKKFTGYAILEPKRN